jgi:hypothetical protein
LHDEAQEETAMANNQNQGSSLSMFVLAGLCTFGAFSVSNDAAQYLLGGASLIALIAGSDRAVAGT